MLSTRFVKMIEKHTSELMATLDTKLKTGPNTESYRRLPDNERFSRSYAVYKNLGEWMERKSQEQVRTHYSQLGRIRFEEDIPLHEVVYALLLTKTTLLEYVESNGLADRVLEVYAMHEFSETVEHFFDHAIYYAVLGYEKAVAEGKRPVASPVTVEATSADLDRLCP